MQLEQKHETERKDSFASNRQTSCLLFPHDQSSIADHLIRKTGLRSKGHIFWLTPVRGGITL